MKIFSRRRRCTTRSLVIFAVIVLFSAPVAISQNAAAAIEARFRIDSLFTRQDSLFAIINAGSIAGVQPGLFVRSFSIFTEVDGIEISSSENGHGTVNHVSPYQSVCHIVPFDRAVPLSPGHHIAVNVITPSLPYQSLLLRLWLGGAEFYDINRRKFFNPQSLITNPSKTAEDSIFERMIVDFRTIYERVKDRSNLAAEMRTPIREGRFKGKTGLQMLNEATQQDIRNFFLYVCTYPAKYVGQKFYLSESFMGWVTSNSPHSSEEVKNALLPYLNNRPELRKRLPAYLYSIKTESHISSFAREAATLAEQHNAKEAADMLRFATIIAEETNDTVGRVGLHLFRAQFFQDAEKYKEAVAECELAIKAAAKCGRTPADRFTECKRMEIASMIKKGFCQYKMSMYGQGLATLSSAEGRLRQYVNTLDRDDYYLNYQKIYEYLGWIHFTSGDYLKAVSDFQAAIAINDSINTFDARTKNASYYRQIGLVYRDQGKYDEALEMFAAARKIYRGLNDAAGDLQLQADEGHVYYFTSDYDQSLAKLKTARAGLQSLKNFDYAGYASSVIGNVYQYLGNYDFAIAAHTEAISLRQAGSSISGEAYSWEQLGKLFQQTGRKLNALDAFNKSIEKYNSIADKAGVAGNYNQVGQLYLNDEDFKTAVDYFEKARGYTNKVNVEALNNLANAWLMLDSVKARQYLLQCLRISTETGNENYRFYSYVKLSKLACRNNDLKYARTCYDSVVQMARRYGTGIAEAMRLDLLGYIKTYELELDEAINAFRQSVMIYDTADVITAAWERLSLSDALISKGEFREAQHVLFQAARIADSTSNLIALGATRVAHSFLYSLLGDFEKGMMENELATIIYKESGNNFRMADAYMARGNLYKATGDFTRSIQALLIADSIYKASKTEGLRSVVFNNIGVTYFSQADYKKAIEYFERAARYFKPGLIDENYLLNRGNVAESYYFLQKNKDAEKLLLASFPLARDRKLNRIASGMAITLGMLYLDAKNYTKSKEYFRIARDMSYESNERDKMLQTDVYLGKISMIGQDTVQARTYFDSAVRLAGGKSYSNYSWIAFYESGLYHYKKGDLEHAINLFKTAAQIVETQSNNVYGDAEAVKLFRNDPRKVDLYGKLVMSLSESGKTGEAWAYANRSNMVGIRELLGNLSNKTGDVNMDAGLEQARSLSQKTEALRMKEDALRSGPQNESTRTQLESISIEKEIAETQFIKYTENLLTRYPDLKENFYDNVNPVDFENYKTQLDENTAVLLYVVNDNKLLIFSLTRERLSITPIVLRYDLAKMIRQFSALLRLPSKSSGTTSVNVRSTIEDADDIDVSKLDFKQVSQQLYEVLVAPAQQAIGMKKNLCIIPNGDLSNIPFQALGKKLTDGSFRFLLEDHMIFYTSRMKIFDLAPPAAGTLSSFAVFGVPDRSLKFTEKEAQSIGNIFQLEGEVYTAQKATEEQAKQSLAEKKYVHFATHGILNYTDYNASYLKFIPSKDTSNGNNGKLTIDEIYELNIAGCDLVTLSACETAVNREKMRGWKISPANSLLRKRVRSVVASMWKVDDEATSILMNEFYNQLKTTGKAEALRRAQARLSQDARYSHPYFWAAFVLYGDWR